MLYQATDRPQDADGVIQAMLKVAPIRTRTDAPPSCIRCSARPDRAAAVRAEARARFGK